MNGHLYFIGIAGHTMRGLALAAEGLGYEVSGLDEPAQAPGSDWLDEHKIKWSRQFNAEDLEGVTAVIVTGAHVSEDYPAIKEAKQRNIPIQSYAELFGELTAGKHVIDVAGTHGKTTTTAMITWLLEAAGKHPDYLIGIRPFNFDTSVRITGSDIVVAEGDEYRASSLETKSKIQYHHPNTLVLTSAEHDHPDFFPDLESVIDRFTQIVSALPKDGHLIIWGENANVARVAKSAPCEVTTYGLAHTDYVARDIVFLPTGLEFDVEEHGHFLGRMAVPLYGRHNVLNSLAATAVSLEEGLQMSDVIAGATKFKGAYRRFNVITDPDASVTVIDDYAHHPTEVSTTIEAAKLHFTGRRIVAVFRPHTYSRTAALLSEYKNAFGSADLVYVTDIEGAREAGLEHTVSGLDITKDLNMPALYAPNRADLVSRINLDSKPGDVVVCMTVSGYDNLAEELADKLQTKR
jgi:UDP-N-acetylmuramate--alanine ligase